MWTSPGVPPRGKKKIINKQGRCWIEEEGSEKKGERIHEQNRSVPLVVFTYERVFNFLFRREFSRDNDNITSHSAHDMKFHSPKVVRIDNQMCKQDTSLLGNVSGVYSRVVFLSVYYERLLLWWAGEVLVPKLGFGMYIDKVKMKHLEVIKLYPDSHHRIKTMLE